MKGRALDEPWPRSAAAARLLQERLRGQVETEDQLGAVERVAGVDAHYGSGDL
jgi:deoxyinosine 3'endonuclease (endonuclease V)